MTGGYNTGAYNIRHIYIAVIAAVSFLAYANALFNGFVFDDTGLIVENPWIKDIRHIPDILTSSVWSFAEEKEVSKYYRPVVYVTYTLEHYLFGLKPFGWHLVNICLHAFTSVVVFLLSTAVFTPVADAPGGRAGSGWHLPHFLAALLFATHPIHTEVVTWVSALSEQSYAMYYLLAFFFYVRAVKSAEKIEGACVMASWRYILSGVFFFLSALSKEPALTLPLLLVLYDYSRDGWRFIKGWTRYLPYAALTALYMMIRVRALGGFMPVAEKSEIDTYHWLINVPYFLVKYIVKLVLPTGLHAYYIVDLYPRLTVGAIFFGVMAIVIVAVAVLVRRRTGVFAALSLFFVPLLPALYLPGLSPMLFAERYVYLPSAGLALLAAGLISFILKASGDGGRARTGILVAVVLVAVLYSAGTMKRNMVWHDDYALWTDTVEKSPKNGVAYYNLGVAAYDLGKYDEAVAAYLKALGLYRRPADILDTYNNLGNAYARSYRLKEAVRSYESALRIDPSNEVALRNLDIVRRMMTQRGTR